MTVFRFITFCWIAFVVYWWVSAWNVKKTAERTSAASRLRYKIWTWIGIILLIGPFHIYPFQMMVVPRSWLTAGSGCILCLAGLLLAVWARRTLARNWSADVTFKEEHELVTRGPYQFVRHPIYTALLLMFLGTALADEKLGSWLSLPFCFIGFWLKYKDEEKLMLQHFPNEYPAYMSRVKALVPFVF